MSVERQLFIKFNEGNDCDESKLLLPLNGALFVP